MVIIRKAGPEDIELLLPLSRQTFMESHGHSASPEDIGSYMDRKFTEGTFREEMEVPHAVFHLLFHEEKPVGYSKIILDTPHSDIPLASVAKLERIYVLKEVYGSSAGQKLLDRNLEVAKQHQQAGIWLYVWKENHRAVAFYKRNGFQIIGEHDFFISDRHSNPNYRMWKRF